MLTVFAELFLTTFYRDRHGRSAHRTAVRMLTACALVALVVLAGCGVDAPPEDPPAVVTEDSPGWDCREDGNGICGPLSATILPGGDIMVYAEGAPLLVVAAEDIN